MAVNGRRQLALMLDSNNTEAVINEVQTIYFHSYSLESFDVIENIFNNINSLFRGEFKGYRECNTEYHDLRHTYDVFLTTARLIDGKNISSGKLSEKRAVNLLISALLHDTGYIQENSDTEGTGAKYTTIHVRRSMQFTEKNAAILKLSKSDVNEISSYIACTGVKSDYISKLSGETKTGGCILGTADLIGQMSDRAYLEKLLFLYYEFSEAGLSGFNTAFDILRKTFSFYETTIERLDKILMKSYDFAEFHFEERFGIKENLYMTAIEKQMNYLKTIIDDESTNFRTKLKRRNMEEADEWYQHHPH